jgi:hypothetical protein
MILDRSLYYYTTKYTQLTLLTIPETQKCTKKNFSRKKITRE